MSLPRLLLTFLCVFSISFVSSAEEDFGECDPKAPEPLLGHVDGSNSRSSELSNLELEPSTYILNCVSIISGEYSNSTTDYVIPGPDPLPIQRSYSSGDNGNGSLCFGTHWGKYSYLMMEEVPIKRNKTEIHAKIVGGGGSQMFYTEGNGGKYSLQEKCYKKGLTNTSAGVISARTNPLNDTLTGDKRYKMLKLVSGGGVVAEYERADKDFPFFLLKKEMKPNGLQVAYSHDKNNRLLGIVSRNRYNHNLASFSCSIEKEHVEVKTSNNKTVSYQFEKLKTPDGKRYFLKSVKRPDRPDEYFDYAAIDSKSPQRLIRKRHPEGRALEIQYYEKCENNPTPMGNIPIRTELDPRLGRVRTLKAPVGHDQTLHNIYKFTYGMTVNNFEVTEGVTSVYDVYNHYTRYLYNTDRRLACVEKHQGQWPTNTLYSKEKLFWDGCRLTNRIFETKEGWAQYAKQYDYDSKGNVLREALWGNLSGYNNKPIAYPPSGYPEYNGCELEYKLYTYSSDGLNLMTSLTEGTTAQAVFTYHPGTDLVASKLSGPIGSIAMREFYEYDQNGVLVIQIDDDGCTPDRDDLTGVTERHIKRILPSSGTITGLPIIIEDKYLDLETGHEGFIQRTVQSYTQDGWLSRKELYDQNNIFVSAERWEYDSVGNVVLYEDPSGGIIQKRYDANHNLIWEEGPTTDFHIEYTYDFCDRLIKKEVVTNQGQRLSEEYIYDMRSCLVATRDIYGNQSSHRFDEFGRKVKTICPEVLDENGLVIAPEINIQFNEMSQPVTTTDAKGATTAKSFTIKGAPYKISYPDGSEEAFIYNVDGTVQKQTHKSGSHTLYTYDYQKRVVTKEVYSSGDELLDATYSVYSGYKLMRETTLGGSEILYTYDARGRLVETNQGGLRIKYAYDSLGRKIETKTYFGPNEDDYVVQINFYDVLNRIIEEREEDHLGNVLKRVGYEYNFAGHRTKVLQHTKNGVSVTSTTYDQYGQPLETIDPEGKKTTTRYDYSTRNSLGQLVAYQEVTDPAGVVTATMKDALGRVSSVVKRNSLGQEIQRVDCFYDGNGNKARQIDTIYQSDHHPREVVTLWLYDPCNRLICTTEAAGAPEQKQTQIIYNKVGLKDAVIKPDGTVLSYTYDQLGRLLIHRSSDDSIHYQYTYDVKGNITQIDDLIQGQMTARRYNDDDQLVEEVLGNGLAISYTYDNMGRQLSITLPDNSGAKYAYQGSCLKQVQRLDREGVATYSHEYEEYDLGGLLLKEKHAGNAGCSSYAYDLCMRQKMRLSPHWKETLQSYDKVGNLLSKTGEDFVGPVHSRFEYDDLSQLTKESGVEEGSYEWDSLYNRVAKNAVSQVHNQLNQLISDGCFSYTYDLNGNLISAKSNDRETLYSYDALDRLIQVDRGDKRYRYSYDDRSRRLSKARYTYAEGDWQLVAMEKFLYQDANEIGAVNLIGEMIQYRLLGAGKGAEIGASVLIELEGAAYAPFHDQAGNIVTLVDVKSGEPVEGYRYTAFGKRHTLGRFGDTLDSAISPWGFSSKRVDEETAFIYFGRRYYHPDLARWITADPLGFEGGPNLYAYVLNNPLTNFDLYGLLSLGSTAFPGSSSHAGLHPFASDFHYSQSHILDAGFNFFSSSAASLWEGARTHCRYELTSARNLCGAGIEGFAWHAVPIPAAQDQLRSTGMFMQNKSTADFLTWRQNKSRSYSLGLPEMHPKLSIVFGGGVDTSLSDMETRAKIASQKIGGFNVHYFYNSTHGFAADSLEWAAQRVGFYTRSAKVMAKACRERIEEMGGVDGGGVVYLRTHSQSGEIASLLPEYLNSRELKMIHVRTFGSPYQIPEGVFGSAWNYVSERDVVPLLNYLSKPHVSNTVILPSNAWVEHGWDCATYQEAFEKDLNLFLERFRAIR